VRELPSQVKGDRLRAYSRRSSCVRIAPPALFFLTQQCIGDKIGWSRENVKNYVSVLEKIGTTNLDLAKSVQSGRVPLNGTIVPLDFTEGWGSSLKV